MDSIESNTHSFVIKVWLEETVEDAGSVLWRGHITHVPSGQRRYFQNLDEILDFILLYLEKMGVIPGTCWRIKQSLKRLKRAIL